MVIIWVRLHHEKKKVADSFINSDCDPLHTFKNLKTHIIMPLTLISLKKSPIITNQQHYSHIIEEF